jgi:uncharacterized protein YbjT (DUF2867 family)
MGIAERPRWDGSMTSTTVLVLGGTGKTGRRITPLLRAAGATVRVASRHADTHFDWTDPATHLPALSGVDAVYLIPPSGALDYAGQVSTFLDRAEAAGVRHVTQLSARGVDRLPAAAAPRAVELDLAARTGLTHSVLRPGWFMQNFTESFLAPVDGVIAAPTGEGAEPFIHVDDIADVAAMTLLQPADHAGASYDLSGPEALTFAEVARRISAVTGLSVTHHDIPRADFVARRIADGMPADYAELLASLLDEALRNDANAATTDAVSRVTGHPARTFDTYASAPESIAAWRRAAPAIRTAPGR